MSSCGEMSTTMGSYGPIQQRATIFSSPTTSPMQPHAAIDTDWRLGVMGSPGTADLGEFRIYCLWKDRGEWASKSKWMMVPFMLVECQMPRIQEPRPLSDTMRRDHNARYLSRWGKISLQHHLPGNPLPFNHRQHAHWQEPLIHQTQPPKQFQRLLSI